MDEDTLYAKIAELQEIADGAHGDGPMVRGAARDELARLRLAESRRQVAAATEGK